MTRRAFSFGSTKWPGIAKLNEECGEVTTVVGKMMNLVDIDNLDHWDGTNLRDEITNEIGDVLAAIAFVLNHCSLDAETIERRKAKKLELFERWHVEQAEPTEEP